MEGKRLVPKRRFEGYKNDWKKSVLEEISTVLTGGTPNTNIKEYWFPKEVPWMSSGEINKDRLNSTEDKISFKGLENSSARWIEKNSVLIALAGQGKTRGKVAINNIRLTTNQSIAAIVPTSKVYYEFLYQNLTKRYEELRLESSGDGTRGGLNKRIIQDVNLLFPLMEEQQKIGQFFKNLDVRIANQERKIAKVKALKEAYLTEMFPQEGETVPKRRFKGFEREWSKFSLGDFGTVEMNKRIFKWQTSKTGDVPFYKIGTFGQKADSFISYDTFKKYKSKYPFPKKGDLLISASGSIGRVVEYKGKDEYFQDSNIVWLKHDGKLNNHFLKQFYYIVKWNGLEGSTIQRLYNKDILETVIYVPPEYKEQQKIGQFFKNLDDQIATEEAKLAKLKKMKEAYLEEMFV